MTLYGLRHLTTAVIAWAVLSALFAAAACAPDPPTGGDSGRGAASADATGPLTPSQVLERARDAMAKQGSYRFDGTWSMGEEPSRKEFRRSGAWSAPDRYRLTFEGMGGASTEGQDLIVLGANAYFRKFPSVEWAPIEISPHLKLEAAGRAVPVLLQARFDGEQEGDYGVMGANPRPLVSPPISGTPQAPQAASDTYTVVIDRATFLAKEITIEMAGFTFDQQAGKWQRDRSQDQCVTVRFFDYGASVSIEKPSPVKAIGESR
ncbi:MAG: hypothetical protein HY682_06645 [Chloroflexi bacterium]|nr:hypothetical protein [Chloroflexota bacterium]